MLSGPRVALKFNDAAIFVFIASNCAEGGRGFESRT